MLSRRFLPGLALLTTGLAGGWLARGWFDPADPATGTRGRAGAPTIQEPPKPQMVAGAAKPPAALELARKLMSANPNEDPGLETFTEDQFATYLERHQRNATSLLAVWQLTKNMAVLKEAYEKFPSDPSVALKAFQYLDLSAGEKRALTARLEQEHPRSPLGSVVAGAQLAKEGHTTEALAKLREALTRGPLNLDVKAQLFAQQEALISLGKSPLEAQLWGLANGFDAYPLNVYRELARPAVEEIRDHQALGNTDATLSAAGDLLALAGQIAREPSRTMVGELVAHSLETAALRSLPPDVEIGESGLTAAERLNELKGLQNSLSRSAESIPWHLSHLDEPGLDLYLQVLDQRGEREAVKWAEAYHGPAPQRPPR